jgi:hypothetical protein
MATVIAARAKLIKNCRRIDLPIQFEAEGKDNEKLTIWCRIARTNEN